jgi:Integrase core domain
MRAASQAWELRAAMKLERPGDQGKRDEARDLAPVYGWFTEGFDTCNLKESNSFNGKFRTECLNAHWFMSLDDARRKCEAWRRDYNEERPHSAIGNKAPIELVNRSAALGPP